MAQYLVIGLGTFGERVALSLTEKGADVVVVDKNRAKVEDIKDKVGVALILDSTDEEAMRAADVENVDGAVVALGDAQEEAILTTAILKRMGISPVVARAADQLYAHVLSLVGADRVVIIEEQMGEEIAKRLLAPEVHEKILLTSGHILAEIEASKGFVGKTLKELGLRRKFGVNVISIQKKVTQIDEEGKVHQTTQVNDLPGSDDRIEEGDVLVLVGSQTNIDRLTLSREVG